MTQVQSEVVGRVIGFSMNTDAELGIMMHLAAAKVGKKHLAWVRDILTDAVNNAGLVNADGTPRTYAPQTKESLKEQLARVTAELAEARAAITPAPPTKIADATTGKVVEKELVAA